MTSSHYRLDLDQAERDQVLDGDGLGATGGLGQPAVGDGRCPALGLALPVPRRDGVQHPALHLGEAGAVPYQLELISPNLTFGDALTPPVMR